MLDAIRGQRPIISVISSRGQNRIHSSSRCDGRVERSLPLPTPIQNRHFVAVPVHKPNLPPPTVPNPPRPRKRVRKNDSLGRIEGVKKGKAKTTSKQKAKATDMQVDEDLVDEDESPPLEPEPRRSKRQRKTISGGYNEGGDTDDELMDDDEFVMDSDLPETALQTQSDGEDDEVVIVKSEEREPSLHSQPRSQSQQPNPSFIDLEAEEEEMKPKPQLQLSFNGFNIFGRCLCVIVEPWPVIRAPTELQMPHSSRMATNSRAPSVVPNSASAGRGQTPLFLPDDDDRGITPAPTARADRPPVPLFDGPPPNNDMQDEGDEEGGMMLFSELLSATGGLRVDVDDEDGFDGAILFGDADERKELS